MKRLLYILISVLTFNYVIGQVIIINNPFSIDSTIGSEIGKNILTQSRVKPITVHCDEFHKNLDTNFTERHSFEIEFLDLVKRNRKIEFRLVRLKESAITIKNIHKKSIKKELEFVRNVTIFLVDTLGQIKGYINDYGNELVTSIENDSILVLKSPHDLNKNTSINLYSSKLNSYIDGRPEHGLMFIQIVYYNNRKVRFTGMQPPGVLK